MTAPSGAETTSTWARGQRLSELWWLLATMASSAVLAAVPLLVNPRFFWADDTQAGAYPIWVTIGRHLREGTLPFFDPAQWASGNYLVEGQWGTFNPVIWLTGLVASFMDNGLLFNSLLTIGWLALAGGGYYLLARNYGAARVWAYAAGLLATLGGFTRWVDAASWVTSLFVWALLPWVWVGLRHVLLRRGNPLWAFVPGYVLVTIGYVHGTLMLVFVILGVLIEGAVARRWHDTIRTLIVSAALGLIALTVYLPGVLSAAVTTRYDAIGNSNFMSPDLSGLMASAMPMARPWLTGFWGMPPNAPLLYIAWILPLAVLIDWRRTVPVLRRSLGVIVVLVLTSVLVFGPSDLGPLRFPARLFPLIAALVLVALAVLLSQGVRKPTKGHVWAVAGFTAWGYVLAWSEAPHFWRGILMGAAAAAGGIYLVMWLVRRGDWLRVTAAIAAVTAVITLGQAWAMRDAILPDFGLPARQSDYTATLADVPGKTVVVGRPSLGSPERRDGTQWWNHTLYANAWYLTDAAVINTYSPVGHRNFNADMHADAHGVFGWESLQTLFSTDRTTGQPVIDLLGIDSVQILARDRAPRGAPAWTVAQDPFTLWDLPEGWHELRRDLESWVITRDEPLNRAPGGIAWASDGVEISEVAVTSREVTFRLDAVPADGGRIAFSRLDWPGYSAKNAEISNSVRDYLLAVDVAPDATGQTVTVTFTPPGFHVGLVTLGIGAGGVLLWGLVAALRRPRRDKVLVPAVRG